MKDKIHVYCRIEFFVSKLFVIVLHLKYFVFENEPFTKQKFGRDQIENICRPPVGTLLE